MTLTLGEILEGVRDLTPQDALEYLKKNKSPHLWFLLDQTLRPNEFNRDVLTISWKMSDLPVGTTMTNLYKELKMIQHFKTTSIVPMKKRQNILIRILESLDKTESGIFLSLLSGTFYNRYSNLNPTDIRNLITLN